MGVEHGSALVGLVHTPASRRLRRSRRRSRPATERRFTTLTLRTPTRPSDDEGAGRREQTRRYEGANTTAAAAVRLASAGAPMSDRLLRRPRRADAISDAVRSGSRGRGHLTKIRDRLGDEVDEAGGRSSSVRDQPPEWSSTGRWLAGRRTACSRGAPRPRACGADVAIWTLNEVGAVYSSWCGRGTARCARTRRRSRHRGPRRACRARASTLGLEGRGVQPEVNPVCSSVEVEGQRVRAEPRVASTTVEPPAAET